MFLSLTYVPILGVAYLTRQLQISARRVLIDSASQGAGTPVKPLEVRLAYLVEAIPNSGPPAFDLGEVHLSILLLLLSQLIYPLLLSFVIKLELLLVLLEFFEVLPRFPETRFLNLRVLSGPLGQLVALFFFFFLKHFF